MRGPDTLIDSGPGFNAQLSRRQFLKGIAGMLGLATVGIASGCTRDTNAESQAKPASTRKKDPFPPLTIIIDKYPQDPPEIILETKPLLSTDILKNLKGYLREARIVNGKTFEQYMNEKGWEMKIETVTPARKGTVRTDVPKDFLRTRGFPTTGVLPEPIQSIINLRDKHSPTHPDHTATFLIPGQTIYYNQTIKMTNIITDEEQLWSAHYLPRDSRDIDPVFNVLEITNNQGTKTFIDQQSAFPATD